MQFKKLDSEVTFKVKMISMLRYLSSFVFIVLILLTHSDNVLGQNPSKKVKVPDWALPESPTHKQVPPPADFHRLTRTDHKSIGVFEGQSDVGAALVAGSSKYNAATKKYTVVSAGYNVWYQRDEFRYVWKKMSGDVSLAATIDFPDTAGYDDRKALVVIRQNLEDDSKEVMVAIHGGGLMHLAWRSEKGQMMQEMRVNNREGLPDLVTGHVNRIGIEKHGNSFSLFASVNGGPMKQIGDPVQLNVEGPFYAGIGFCSHLPATLDTAVFSNLVFENRSGFLK